MEFPLSEYEARLAGIHREMEKQHIDALILTNDKNIRYISGYHNQGWISPTRARYLVLNIGEPPIAVIPSTNVIGFKQLSWISNITHWSNPLAGSEGVDLLVDAMTKGGKPHVARIGIESGPESRWQSTLEDLWDLQRKLNGVQFVDAQRILRTVRTMKSDPEISIMRELAQTVSSVLDEVETLGSPSTEMDVYFNFMRRFIEQRIERVPYLVITSGTDGYEQINTGPLNRTLHKRSILCVDTGCSQSGYFCDFTRNYSIGQPDERINSVYERLNQAMEAGLERVRPGERCCDVWADMAAALGDSASRTPVGRMGHGIGMDVTEPPSIASFDETILQPGMTLAIEPSLVFEMNGSRKIMVHEENVIVTEKGPVLLSKRAPVTIHIVEDAS